LRCAAEAGAMCDWDQDAIEKTVPTKTAYVILDNYAAHKHP
jgi:hypothetical protein